jgi:hypothetical protein
MPIWVLRADIEEMIRITLEVEKLLWGLIEELDQAESNEAETSTLDADALGPT